MKRKTTEIARIFEKEPISICNTKKLISRNIKYPNLNLNRKEELGFHLQ